jgi:predicted regulator of Ras-like GTPase activity (Roadblock/LC7/MglB family)
MPSGAASWTFTDDDADAITDALQHLLRESRARCALLVDRAGQLITTVGETPSGEDFDVTAFASLTAADFSANDQLAQLIGEKDFSTLSHQGERESMLLADVARRVILVVLFDNRTTLGLVRFTMRSTVAELAERFQHVFSRGPARPTRPRLPSFLDDDSDDESPPAPPGPLAGPAVPAPADLLVGAEDEIDRLFA